MSFITFIVQPDILNPEFTEKFNIPFVENIRLSEILNSQNIDFEGVKLLITNCDQLPVDLNYICVENDIITIKCLYDAPVIAGIAAGAGAAIGGASLVSSLLIAALTIASTFLMQILGPKIESGSDASQTYSWDDLQNQVDEGSVIPILFGKHKVAGQILNQFINLNGSKEYLNVLVGLACHEIDSITDIRVNDQPSTYYNNVSYETRLGTLNQTPIQGFGEISTYRDLNIKLKRNTEHTYQTDGNAVEKIELIFNAPNGLYRADDEGDYHSVNVDMDISYRVLGSGFWIKYKTHRISGKSKESVRNSCVIDNLSPAQYEVKIVRTTSDSTDFKVVDFVYFDSFREIVKEELSYPGIPLLGIKALASDQLSGSTPSFTCTIERAYVNVYNPYRKLWVQRSAYNPAWQAYDLLVNHHNINKDYIIYDEFKAWADYNEEVINDETGEKRFVASIYLDNQASVWTNVQRIANIARAFIIRKGMFYGVFVDKAETIVSHVFNMSNIVSDSFSMTYFNADERANAYEITYSDPDRDYTNQIAAVYSDEYKSSETQDKKTSSQVYAAIPAKQAYRSAAFSLNKNRLEKKAISFKALSDSFNCGVGDLFYFLHQVPNQNSTFSGRINEAWNEAGHGYVELDQNIVPVEGYTYSFIVRDEQDRISEFTVIDFNEDIIQLNQAFTNVPTADSIYILGKNDILKKIYRLNEVKSSNDGFSTLTATEYVSEVYTDDSYSIEEDEIEIEVVQDAVNVHVNERLVYAPSGDFASVIDVNWSTTKFDGGSNWDIYLQKITNLNEFSDGFDDAFIGDGISDEIIFIASTTYNQFTVPTSKIENNEIYRVYICASNRGIYNTGQNTATITTKGKLNPPTDVTYFNAVWDSQTRTIVFSWTLIPDIDNHIYEIRKGSDWETAELVITAPFNQNSISYLVPVGTSESVTYLIKACDTSSIYSINSASKTLDVDTSETTIETPENLVLTTYTVINSDGAAKTYINADWDSNAELSQYFQAYSILLTDNSSDRVNEYITQESEYTWEVIANKSYGVQVQSIDSNNNRSAYSASVAITSATDCEAPDTVTGLTVTAGFKTMFLKWNESTAKDINYYFVQRSTNQTFSNNVVNVGAKSGTFTTDTNLDVNAEYYYRIKAYDTSNNESDWSNYASNTTLQVGSEDIAYNSICANHIFVNNLSAITANCGTLTSGIIQSSDWSNTAGFMLDLDNEVMKFGGNTSPRFEFDGNAVTLRNTNEGEELTLSGTQITLGNATDGDYMNLSSGDINFYRYIDGDHRRTKSLKRIESGVANSGIVTVIPGFWQAPPKIIVSPYSARFYDPAYSSQAQSVRGNAVNIEETTEGSGVYQFTPQMELVLSSGTVFLDPTDDTASGSKTSGYDNYIDYISTGFSSPANTTRLQINGSYHGRRNSGGLTPNQFLKFEVALLIDDVALTPNVYTIDQNMGIGNEYIERSGNFSIQTSVMTAGVHTIKARLRLYLADTASVTLKSFIANVSGATVIAEGVCNYFAIGE